MLPVFDQLAIYEEMCTFSGRMVTAAQANDWDKLIALESRVAALRDKLMHEEGNAVLALSLAESERKSVMIRKILEDDTEIRHHIEPWMENVRPFLGSQTQRKKLQKTYAAADATPDSGPAMDAW